MQVAVGRKTGCCKKVRFFSKEKGMNNSESIRRVLIQFADESNDLIDKVDHADNTHMYTLLNFIDDDADGNYINSSEHGTLLYNDTDSIRTKIDDAKVL